MKPELISRIPLFASLPNEEIENLANTLQLREYPAQTIILHEGHASDRSLFLLEGRVEIIKALGTADERRVAVVQGGAFLGEMSLFSQEHRHTASARTLEPLKLLEITRADFDSLLRRQPQVAYEVVRILSKRLEDSENLTIVDLKEKNRQLEVAYEELKVAQAQIIEKEKLEKELEIARQIQSSILPECPPYRQGFDCGALMIPARVVGGDFYSFIQLDEEHLGIVVGDVSDKGVPAALFMALTYSLIAAEAEIAISPAETLRKVNHHLLGMNAASMFVTLLYGILNFNTGLFQYARAGHLVPVILARDGQAIEIPMELGQPLGLFDEPIMDEQSLIIPAGGMALIFSDGLSEAADAQNNQFGSEGLQKVCIAVHAETAQEICQQLWLAVQSHSGDFPQQDDFTVIAIKRD